MLKKIMEKLYEILFKEEDPVKDIQRNYCKYMKGYKNYKTR